MAHQKPYTTEQFWQAYETLPKDIQDALWAPQTAENIADIITKNNLDEFHDEVLDLCGQVFLGMILPQEAQRELEKVGVPTENAQKAAQQLNGLIFYPVKAGLETLHRNVAAQNNLPERLNIEPARHRTGQAPAQQTQDDYTVEETQQPQEEQPPRQPSFQKDIYRESIDEEE